MGPGGILVLKRLLLGHLVTQGLRVRGSQCISFPMAAVEENVLV